MCMKLLNNFYNYFFIKGVLHLLHSKCANGISPFSLIPALCYSKKWAFTRRERKCVKRVVVIVQSNHVYINVISYLCLQVLFLSLPLQSENNPGINFLDLICIMCVGCIGFLT